MICVTPGNAALLVDLYELTMADSYHRRGMNHAATFDLFIRELPPQRNFLVACGLDEALAYLENLSFDPDAVSYLRSLHLFSDDFLDRLADLAFTGEVCAIPEGEIAFAGEPLLRVTAPLVEAQIVETFLLNCLTFQTMVASKAARVAIASGERQFVDFSARRTHGADAALKAARAAYVAGAAATSNVLAGQAYGIPVTGTMAHSYVMAFPTEVDAFRAFTNDFPSHTTLLIDTFDTREGARRAARVAHELQRHGSILAGVRLDSGDLAELSRATRAILDDAGLSDVTIIASGDLDEYRIADLVAEGAPIGSFGVGTQLGTSGDAPSLGGVYKLVAEDGEPKMKLSTGKLTLPGIKQVFRTSSGGLYESDVVGLEHEDVEGVPLLQQVMKAGRRVLDREPLGGIRKRCRDSLSRLPQDVRSLERRTRFPVRRSPRLDELVSESASVPH
ncbi:MAG: nicotinate phosphoribosyltransferase [Actinomycetota bacterium]